MVLYRGRRDRRDVFRSGFNSLSLTLRRVVCFGMAGATKVRFRALVAAFATLHYGGIVLAPSAPGYSQQPLLRR